VHGLEFEYYDRINFVYLDIDDPANDRFEDVLGFRYQPQVFILGGEGQVLYEWIGAPSRDELVAAFGDVLSQ
jgi:hypothetical protein